MIGNGHAYAVHRRTQANGAARCDCARAITMPVQEASPKGEDDWKQIISTTYRNFYVKTGKITEDIADSVIKIVYNIVGEECHRKFNILFYILVL